MLTLKGIVGIYPANTVGDDIEVYEDEDRRQAQHRFFGLRQQAEKENNSDPYLCISDFIAPKASNVPDYLGLFANGTFGVEGMVDKFKADVSIPLFLNLWHSSPTLFSPVLLFIGGIVCTHQSFGSTLGHTEQ